MNMILIQKNVWGKMESIFLIFRKISSENSMLVLEENGI